VFAFTYFILCASVAISLFLFAEYSVEMWLWAPTSKRAMLGSVSPPELLIEVKSLNALAYGETFRWKMKVAGERTLSKKHRKWADVGGKTCCKEQAVGTDDSSDSDESRRVNPLQHAKGAMIEMTKRKKATGREDDSDADPNTDPGALPEGWTEHETPEGYPYYINTADGTSHWDRPMDARGRKRGSLSAPSWARDILGQIRPPKPRAHGMFATASAEGGGGSAFAKAKVLHSTMKSELKKAHESMLDATNASELKKVHGALMSTIRSAPDGDGRAPPGAPPSLPEGWSEHVDKAGHTYYVHADGRPSEWERPHEAVKGSITTLSVFGHMRAFASKPTITELPPGWVEEVHDVDGNSVPYWHHAERNESVWVKPKRAVKASLHSTIKKELKLAHGAMVDATNEQVLKSALKGMWGTTSAPSESRTSTSLPPGWVEEVHDVDGRPIPYWHHAERNESVWVKPEAVAKQSLSSKVGNAFARFRPGAASGAASVALDAPLEGSELEGGEVTRGSRSVFARIQRRVDANAKAKALQPGWVEYADAESGAPYWHHAERDETVWVQPAPSGRLAKLRAHLLAKKKRKKRRASIDDASASSSGTSSTSSSSSSSSDDDDEEGMGRVYAGTGPTVV